MPLLVRGSPDLEHACSLTCTLFVNKSADACTVQRGFQAWHPRDPRFREFLVDRFLGDLLELPEFLGRTRDSQAVLLPLNGLVELTLAEHLGQSRKFIPPAGGEHSEDPLDFRAAQCPADRGIWESELFRTLVIDQEQVNGSVLDSLPLLRLITSAPSDPPRHRCDDRGEDSQDVGGIAKPVPELCHGFTPYQPPVSRCRVGGIFALLGFSDPRVVGVDAFVTRHRSPISCYSNCDAYGWITFV